MADVYTHGHHDSVLRSHRWRTVANSAAYLVPRLRPGLDLLDVGCGPATLTADLARLVAPGRVVGLDVAPAVLGEALAATGDQPNVEIVAGDVYRLPADSDSFDVVHAHQVLQHLTDPVAALVEMKRVCRPDGVVAVRDADYGAMTWWPELPALTAWLELYRQVARTNRAEPDTGRRVAAWGAAAGFGEVEASASVWCFATPEERRWWGGLWSERMRESELARQAFDYGLADRPLLDSIVAGWEEWARREDGWFAVLHGEILCRPG
ncbi:MAG TPA: methyltransferase domain-containing protein [Acidimicrobiia bacterium]|nr:methyltransferase domain-containing protein [Acidimicrobiia bacterium]